MVFPAERVRIDPVSGRRICTRAVSFGGDYLAVPNIGILGSRGANAIPLFATLLSWGRAGLAQRVETAMRLADELVMFLQSLPGVRIYAPNASGVILWRSEDHTDVHKILERLPTGSASSTSVKGQQWIRHVAANPDMKIGVLTDAIATSLR